MAHRCHHTTLSELLRKVRRILRDLKAGKVKGMAKTVISLRSDFMISSSKLILASSSRLIIRHTCSSYAAANFEKTATSFKEQNVKGKHTVATMTTNAFQKIPPVFLSAASFLFVLQRS